MAGLEVSVQKDLRGFSLALSFCTGANCLGILGASGCGKSMTLRCIAGVAAPDRGRIALEERVLYDSAAGIDLPPQKRQVGYLFQNCALFANMAVAENLAAGLGKRSRREKAETVARMVERFRLSGLEDRYPRQLSGGQQQRVALGRSLARDPDLLLLDEPFSALDAHLREELLLELRQILEEFQGTAVLVTHSREEAFFLCRELLILDRGRLSAFGETKAIFRAPGTVQAAILTGCRNIVRAERAGEDRLWVPDWNALLAIGRPVPEGITHLGIPARSLHPPEEGEENRLAVVSPVVMEGPAQSQVVFSPGEDPKVRLWWEPEGGAGSGIPGELAVRPRDILLLTE